MSNPESWWAKAQQPSAVRSDNHEWIFQWAQQALAVRALQEGKLAPLRVGGAGPVADEEAYPKLTALLKAQGATLVEESFYVWDDDFEEVYVWDEGAAFITSADDSVQLGINLVTTNCEFAETIRQFMHENLLRKSRTNQGKVYILVQTESGVRPSPLGFAAVPLDVENYDPQIQEAIKQAVSDLQTPFPDGRLTILEGPPGCGKTFLIRSLVHEIPAAKFVFVPPAMVPQLGDPSLVSALLSLNENEPVEDDSLYVGPTVLICEDADSILTARAADNMPAISSVLNLTSGLLGDVIDIRIVATTNAPKTDIEPALLRSGRLAQYIQVPPVKRDHADAILKKLVPDAPDGHVWPAAKVPKFGRRGSVGFMTDESTELKDQVLLADVFKFAKSLGWKPKKVRAKVDAARVVPRRPRPYAAPEEKKARSSGLRLGKSLRAVRHG
jgi:energy-coupling factor transporter ATP-binding protein EcfA2